jgi:hypothetical protein
LGALLSIFAETADRQQPTAVLKFIPFVLNGGLRSVVVLLGFAMLPVTPAARAILLKLKPVRIIAAIFFRSIVTLTAFRTSQSHYHTYRFFSHNSQKEG